MQLKPSTAILLCLFLSASAVRGQTAPSPTDAAPAPAPAAEADAAYGKLYEAFGRLKNSLAAIKAAGPNEQQAMATFRQQVREFSAQHADDLRSRAMDLVLSKWMKDNQSIGELYAWLLERKPESNDLRVGWAEYLFSRNEYDRVMQALEAVTWDAEKNPRVIKMIGDCHRAADRYEQALEAYRSIPQAALDSDAGLKKDITEVMTNLADYPKYWQEELAARASDDAGEPLPLVELLTSKGRIVVELFENHAPNTTANFVSLTESGFYEQVKFRPVVPNFKAQTGDPRQYVDETKRTALDGPGYTIVDEFARPDFRRHFTGTLSMFISGTNNGGSQFFIAVNAAPWLDARMTVFGRVTEGMEIARSLVADDALLSARVIRKRDHEYVAPMINLPPPPTETDAPPTAPTPVTDTPAAPAAPSDAPPTNPQE